MIKVANPQWFRFFKKTAATLFILEGLGFAGSYYFWYRLNTNRDFRKYCHENYPIILEGYYKVGETFDSKDSIAKIRQTDLAIWASIPPKQQ